VIDPRSGAGRDSFKVSLRIDRPDHCLKFRSVLTEVVPQRRERGGLGRTPRRGKPPGQQCGRSKVFFEVMCRSVAGSAVGDRCRRDLDACVERWSSHMKRQRTFSICSYGGIAAESSFFAPPSDKSDQSEPAAGLMQTCAS